MTQITNEMRYCVKYLVDNDVGPEEFTRIAKTLKYFNKHYKLIETKPDFFTELAGTLRGMWPPGKKEGQWEWRDSVGNLSRRLQLLWQVRDLPGDVTIDDCVDAARTYLAKFKGDTKYMRTLKYFILRQSRFSKDGRQDIGNDSPFADILSSSMLEMRVERQLEKEAEEMMSEASEYHLNDLV